MRKPRNWPSSNPPTTAKPFREALSEIRYGAWTLEYFAGLTDKIEGSTIPVPGARLNYTLRQPLGVTAHIVPWNFPLQLALRSIAPALAAGCTVIAKPASWTPLSLLAWAKAMDEADTGLPSGVLQVLTGSGALAGDALAGHAGVDGDRAHRWRAHGSSGDGKGQRAADPRHPRTGR